MINSSSLGNYLNSFKNNVNSPETPKENSIEITNPIITILAFIISWLISVSKIFVYGYAFKIIFSTNWSFIETSIIGLAFVFFIDFIQLLTHK